MLASLLLFSDYSLSWSKASQSTYLIKSFVYIAAFFVYAPLFYGKVRFALMASELFFYLFAINFAVYFYYYLVNKNYVKKTKTVVIYGAGKAGTKLKSEFDNTEYKVKYFVDDDKYIHNRSVDSVKIISKQKLKDKIGNEKFDLLVIAMPSASKTRIKEIYDRLSVYFKQVQVLPAMDEILKTQDFSTQLKNISVEDLLARHPKDLDKKTILKFIKDKTVLVTGAGGSIGSEICRQCEKYGAKKLILLDHSEYNLYTIEQEITRVSKAAVLQSVTEKDFLDKTFEKHKPDIVIHAAAYKHVPLVEYNPDEAILNNIIGTKNCIDLSVKHKVKKFILISTDKAVRPTNIMGTTKRICELYAQNSNGKGTDIVGVRFGNVLGSSGSVIPKFRKQIQNGGPVTVTHPEITRYFMLIPEACELVLQAGAIGSGGEIFVLDMGKPIKIVDLAKKMIELSGKKNIKIEFTGLRPGEKLYEELLISDSDQTTKYESIFVAKPTFYDIDKLNKDIKELLTSKNKLKKLKDIIPEFDHKNNIK
jgi:FlaA1/EpsC-like NDP-sugar epimerase